MTRNTTSLSESGTITFKPDGEEAKKIGASFFRGSSTNFNPYRRDYDRSNFIEKFLMKGVTPATPQLSAKTRITAFGSCFAANITKHLSKVGYDLSQTRNPDIYISKMGEGLVNVHALAQQFEWALENATPPENLWHGYTAESFGYDEAIRQRTADAFLNTDFFIITLGLSEVWYDEVTGGVFWRAVPMENYDETRHKFRVCTVDETKHLIARIDELIRKHVPQAKLLFTLSPVPLAATFRPVGCISANSASKAILRAALDEFYRDNEVRLNESLFYFPSYEIVSNLFYAPFGIDGRHPYPEILDFIMHLFQATYCDTELTVTEVNTLYQKVRSQNLQDLLATRK